MFGFNGGAARLGNKEYDSGNPRHGLFAVTAEGNAVQLTNDSDIEPNNLDSWIYGGGVLHGMQWAACDGVANGRSRIWRPAGRARRSPNTASTSWNWTRTTWLPTRRFPPTSW